MRQLDPFTQPWNNKRKGLYQNNYPNIYYAPNTANITDPRSELANLIPSI
jgi:hypothetical protein